MVSEGVEENWAENGALQNPSSDWCQPSVTLVTVTLCCPTCRPVVHPLSNSVLQLCAEHFVHKFVSASLFSLNAFTAKLVQKLFLSFIKMYLRYLLGSPSHIYLTVLQLPEASARFCSVHWKIVSFEITDSNWRVLLPWPV